MVYLMYAYQKCCKKISCFDCKQLKDITIWQFMKIVHHYADDHVDWLVSEHLSINPVREAIFLLSDNTCLS